MAAMGTRMVVSAGLTAFSAKGYDRVDLDEIARLAGLDRSDVDEFFDGKIDLFMAVVQRVVLDIAAVTEPQPELAPERQLRTALERYVEWAREHADTYLAVHRNGPISHPQVRAMIEASRDMQTRRFLDILAPEVRDAPLVQLVVRGWVEQLVFCCLRWLETRAVDAEDLLDVLVDALFGGVAAATRVSADDPTDW